MSDNNKLDYIQDRIDTIIDRVHDLNKYVESQKLSLNLHQEQQDQIAKELSRMNDILAKNTMSLEDHMRRTDLLEQHVKLVEERFRPLETENARKLAVRAWIAQQAKFVIKTAAFISGVSGIAYVLQKAIIFAVNN